MSKSKHLLNLQDNPKFEKPHITFLRRKHDTICYYYCNVHNHMTAAAAEFCNYWNGKYSTSHKIHSKEG